MGSREDVLRPSAALYTMDDRKTTADSGRVVTQAGESPETQQITSSAATSEPPVTTSAADNISSATSPSSVSWADELRPTGASKSDSQPQEPETKTTDIRTNDAKTEPKTDDANTKDANKKAAAEDLASRLFRWLSTATPDSLGAVGVGLAATTYFVLGRVGLVLMGAFGGVVLFVAWEARSPAVSRIARGESGTDTLARVIEYRKRQDKRRQALDAGEEEGDDEGQDRALAQEFDGFRPATRLALEDFVDAIIRDYVKWWYDPIVAADTSFALSCRRVLTSFLVSVSNHLSRKRPADAFLDFLTNSSSIVIVFFAELASAFAEMPPPQPGADSTTVAADSVYSYLAANPDSSLANLLNKRQQAAKFRLVAEDVLRFLDRQTYEFSPAHNFLREIVANSVLESTLQTCSKAEWINGWIVYLLEAGEPDFSQAIDVGMQTRADAGSSASQSASNTATYFDIDGNVGNIALAKSVEKPRRKESVVHRKQLSRADEEMEEAMEEMKRMNQMIADEEARRKDGAAGPFSDAGAASPSVSAHTSPKASVSLSGDERARVSDAFAMPPTPKSSTGESPREPAFSSETTPPMPTSAQFTSFDQLVPPGQDDAELSDMESRKQPPPLTLHNAAITIHDEPVADKGRLKSKPAYEFLLQIEPANSHYPGWMIVRKYGDFERLHEVLRRIAAISGAAAFAEQHSALPNWKLHTRGSLRGDLERYVRDACAFQPLAESEGMKRFLEKDTNNMPASKGGFLALENMGKNVLDALANAPKGVAESGKVMVGGVTGVLGNIGSIAGIQKRHSNTASLSISAGGSSSGSSGGSGHQVVTPTSSVLQDVTAYTNRLSISTPPRIDSLSGSRLSRDSMDSQRSSVVSTQPGRTPPMDRHMSYQLPSGLATTPTTGGGSGSGGTGDESADGLHRTRGRTDMWDFGALLTRGSRASSIVGQMTRSPSSGSISGLRQPPPPPPPVPGELAADELLGEDASPVLSPSRLSTSSSGAGAWPAGRRKSVPGSGPGSGPGTGPEAGSAPRWQPAPAATSYTKQYAGISEAETRVAVELLFTVINELYTLSSAWNIRRTLLAAAKSFLLRPGNPSLGSIQALMQSSVLEAHTSDAGMAALLQQLRANVLPTEAERAAWPAPTTAEDRERLRVKARALLIRSGVPAALMGVMGQTATADALGRVFDCLQVEEVARGLIFGIMLQAARVVTH